MTLCIANQLTGFYKKGNNGRLSVKRKEPNKILLTLRPAKNPGTPNHVPIVPGTRNSRTLL